ncbi:putative transmembrane protein [Rhizoctonia solani 123E]|uniref:Putative transmembrane protein n=1 Tax=Rhizoctonia solani 123E TaxID=1423351 RepID=A0A074RG15_9AGAM|nr:putative transmembrane protein [Rhizoctonia solani 123E]
MIQRWRLQELISALPLLIHLSLFLFAIGLCLYLWELNRTAAKPVISVFGAIFLFYCFSSIAAAFSKQSPYATILTKVIRSRFMKAVIWHALQPNELTDKYTTSLALDWLIQYCETPSAVNIALQSIAGASWNVDKRPLMQSQATVQILQRIVSSNASNQEIDSISLYKRALQFLGSAPERSSISYPVENSDPVATIWYLQLQSER